MKGKISVIFGVVLIIAGVLLCLSPDIINRLCRANVDIMARDFEDDHIYQASKMQESELSNDPLYQQILDYNESIFSQGQSGFTDPWQLEQSPVELDGLEDEIFGYIHIPSMDETFPIYLGASEMHLNQGVAVLGQTSIPVGGNNTNSVIAGHRGWYQSLDFFLHIEKVRVGDEVYITNPWETLTYIVCQMDIIDPYDIDAVKIQKGRDMVTLMTCHPYASGGKYRYLVYCERKIENTEIKATAAQEDVSGGESDIFAASDGNPVTLSEDRISRETLFRKCCLIGMGVLVFICILTRVYRNQKNKRKEI